MRPLASLPEFCGVAVAGAAAPAAWLPGGPTIAKRCRHWNETSHRGAGGNGGSLQRILKGLGTDSGPTLRRSLKGLGAYTQLTPLTHVAALVWSAAGCMLPWCGAQQDAAYGEQRHGQPTIWIRFGMPLEHFLFSSSSYGPGSIICKADLTGQWRWYKLRKPDGCCCWIHTRGQAMVVILINIWCFCLCCCSRFTPNTRRLYYTMSCKGTQLAHSRTLVKVIRSFESDILNKERIRRCDAGK